MKPILNQKNGNLLGKDISNPICHKYVLLVTQKKRLDSISIIKLIKDLGKRN